MYNKCERCNREMFEAPVIMVNAYHSWLCFDCRRDFDVFAYDMHEFQVWQMRQCQFDCLCGYMKTTGVFMAKEWNDLYADVTKQRAKIIGIIKEWIAKGK